MLGRLKIFFCFAGEESRLIAQELATALHAKGHTTIIDRDALADDPTGHVDVALFGHIKSANFLVVLVDEGLDVFRSYPKGEIEIFIQHHPRSYTWRTIPVATSAGMKPEDWLPKVKRLNAFEFVPRTGNPWLLHAIERRRRKQWFRLLALVGASLILFAGLAVAARRPSHELRGAVEGLLARSVPPEPPPHPPKDFIHIDYDRHGTKVAYFANETLTEACVKDLKKLAEKNSATNVPLESLKRALQFHPGRRLRMLEEGFDTSFLEQNPVTKRQRELLGNCTFLRSLIKCEDVVSRIVFPLDKTTRKVIVLEPNICDTRAGWRTRMVHFFFRFTPGIPHGMPGEMVLTGGDGYRKKVFLKPLSPKTQEEQVSSSAFYVLPPECRPVESGGWIASVELQEKRYPTDLRLECHESPSAKEANGKGVSP